MTLKTPFSGGSGILPEKKMSPKAALYYGLATLSIAIILGFNLVFTRRWQILEECYPYSFNTFSRSNGVICFVTNQNFVSIPFRKLIKFLEYKLEELGIKVVQTDEPYTSKASSLSDDILEILKRYAEVREKQENIKIKYSGKSI